MERKDRPAIVRSAVKGPSKQRQFMPFAVNSSRAPVFRREESRRRGFADPKIQMGADRGARNTRAIGA